MSNRIRQSNKDKKLASIKNVCYALEQRVFHAVQPEQLAVMNLLAIYYEEINRLSPRKGNTVFESKL